jgi:multiple sugar transport system permease protein
VAVTELEQATPARPSRLRAGAKGATESLTERRFLGAAAWPALIVMVAVTGFPFVISVGMSFTNYNLVHPHDWQFVGLANFREIVDDPQVPRIIGNTLYLAFSTTAIETAAGLGLALLMDSRVRGMGMIRTLYLLPIMTAPVIVAITWRAMFANGSGWINWFLGGLHLPQPTWLGDPHLAMPTVIVADMWTGVSFQAVLIFAGLLNVPMELREAAESDGAGRFRVFWHVVLPSLRPVLFIAIVLRLLEGFRKFEGIQLLTTGGPGIASTPLNLYIYNSGLFYDRLGYASALSIVMIGVIAASLLAVYLVCRGWWTGGTLR